MLYLIFQCHVFAAAVQLTVDSVHVGHDLCIIIIIQWVDISKFR